MTEELYNKIDKFCNETDWKKYPTYEHALEEFIKGIVAEETKELEAQIEKMINEIDRTMVLSNMRECEICDIQDIFRKYGFNRNEGKWEFVK